MKNKFLLLKLDKDYSNIVNNFLLSAGKALLTFRYFNKRDTGVIKNHICTYILLEDNHPVGYGHLERENQIVWLGIAISETAQGKGYGKMMITKLLDTAKKLNLEEVNLSVDFDNENAIQLYLKYGFVLQKKIDKTLFFKKTISE